MNKKGFTIVELVIVIAVIAILAAVLIPTFTGIIKKANISADTQLVRNLNTALAEDKAINGEHKTMQSALDAAVEGGYIVARINAKATGNEILWDSVADAFCYLNDGKVEYTPDVTGEKAKGTEQYKLWKIDSVPNTTYSTYLYNIGETTTFNVTTGIDVGNEKVTSISYDRTGATGQEVVIRTNGGNLTVDAENDTVKHFGTAVLVKVDSVAPHSYYENGFVSGGLYVTKGHVVVNASAENNKAATLVVINGADVDVEVKDSTPVMLAAGVTPTDNTKLNGAKVSENSNVKTIEELTDSSNFIEKVQAGGIYALGNDITVSNTVRIPANISTTIDLKGHSIFGGNIVLSVLNGGELIVNDSIGGGTVSGTLTGILMGTRNPDLSKIAVLTINGGTILGGYGGVYGNGTYHNTLITINGGVIRGTDEDSAGIYHPQKGTLIITGGVIEGATGIYMKSGTLTLDSKFVGGTIRGTGTKSEFKHDGNGFNSTGDAISIENCDYPGGTPSLSLGNVNLESTNGYEIGAYYYERDGIAGITSISNKFTLNDGYKWEQTVSGVYIVVKAD